MKTDEWVDIILWAYRKGYQDAGHVLTTAQPDVTELKKMLVKKFNSIKK